VSLHGGTPASDREANVFRFQDSKSCRVFIGQIIAAGTGLTLTAADRAIFIEADWTPANMAQAAKRSIGLGRISLAHPGSIPHRIIR
jgi:SWI/SNF-related matrix-associated actin-dependent regulator 1 of chromatin subfamily A